MVLLVFGNSAPTAVKKSHEEIIYIKDEVAPGIYPADYRRLFNHQESLRCHEDAFLKYTHDDELEVFFYKDNDTNPYDLAYSVKLATYENKYFWCPIRGKFVLLYNPVSGNRISSSDPYREQLVFTIILTGLHFLLYMVEAGVLQGEFFPCPGWAVNTSNIWLSFMWAYYQPANENYNKDDYKSDGMTKSKFYPPIQYHFCHNELMRYYFVRKSWDVIRSFFESNYEINLAEIPTPDVIKMAISNLN